MCRWGELACTHNYPGDATCYESDEAAAAAFAAHAGGEKAEL